MKTPHGALGILVLALLTSRIDAAVIYDNGGPLLTVAQGALFADESYIPREAADDFTLPAGFNVIREIHWWGTHQVTGGDAFTIKIYDDAGGAPGGLVTTVSLLSLSRHATATTILGKTMHAYDAVVADVALTPLTAYWLGISNNSNLTTGGGWKWVISDDTGNARQYSQETNLWEFRNKSLAFNLTNVPEPSTYVMAAIGIVALLFARRRKVR